MIYEAQKKLAELNEAMEQFDKELGVKVSEAKECFEKQLKTIKRLDECERFFSLSTSPTAKKMTLKAVIRLEGIGNEEFNLTELISEAGMQDIQAIIIDELKKTKYASVTQLFKLQNLDKQEESQEPVEQPTEDPEEQLQENNSHEQTAETVDIPEAEEEAYERAKAAKAGDEVLCPNCGEPFTKKNNLQTFCSDKCRKQYHDKKKGGKE